MRDGVCGKDERPAVMGDLQAVGRYLRQYFLDRTAGNRQAPDRLAAAFASDKVNRCAVRRDRKFADLLVEAFRQLYGLAARKVVTHDTPTIRLKARGRFREIE